ncbi:MFS transporter [Zopfia rhizophila CBS 207.26]|uniref:MFS transporter n=1 Tax=Zopfia rhizophila CBS 207.26 TaxID=1314779 RepID=A0A6A6DTR7_9PEZI|nr:MFS transporter [Zopfia rhizophila CBS 207.26]
MANHIKEKDSMNVQHVDVLDTKIETGPLDKFGAAEKRDPLEIVLVRKLDWYIMPILVLMYFLNFLDRMAIVNGKIDGLAKDLHLKGYQYNTCVSILFVGYLLGQVPSNMMMNRVKPAWWMSGWMMAWAIVSTLNCLVKSYESMVVCRFLLGITEAPFYPGALFMISLFYTRKEAATRMAFLYSGNMLASAFAGLIAAGVFAGLDGKAGLEGWRWLFLLQGVVTVVVAAAAFFILPNAPLQTHWLTPLERELAHARIARDTTGKRMATSTWSGLKEAASDYRTWIFALMCQLHLAANGFKNFLPTAVETLGFNKTVTLVLTCPPYLIGTFTAILVSWSSGRFNERTWHITISKAVAITGFVLGCATLNVGARYFAMVLFVSATYGVNNINLAWVASTCGQTDEKKAVALAMANMIGNISMIYTPYLWPDSDAPRYAKAMAASSGFSIGVVICAWVMRYLLKRENRRIKAQESEAVNFYAY